jgi:Ran GTPase-activating protein (RanGAP) involved in mRNA processing and transport
LCNSSFSCTSSLLISSLRLENNLIGPQGASKIAEALMLNTSITEIRLNPSSSHISTLVSHSSLHLLISLGENNIGDEGASKLAEVILSNTSILEI